MARNTENQEFILVGQYFGSGSRKYNGNTYYEMNVLQPFSETLCRYSITEPIFNEVSQYKNGKAIACNAGVEVSTFNGNTRARRVISFVKPLEDWISEMNTTSAEDLLESGL